MKHKWDTAGKFNCLRFIWNLSPSSFIEMITYGILNSAIAVISVWITRQVLSLVHDGYTPKMLWMLLVYGIMLILSAGYSVWYKRYRVQFHAILDFERKLRSQLHRKSQRISNETFEESNANILIRMADGARQNLFRYVEIWISIAMAILQSIAVVVYTSTFHLWFLLLLPMSIIPPCLTLAYQAKIWKKYYEATEQCKWEESEYLKAMIDEVACKESRITYASSLLTEKWLKCRSSRDRIENMKSNMMLFLRVLLTPLEMLGSAGGYLVSLFLLFYGKIDYATCTAGIAAYTSLLSAFSSLVGMLGNETQYWQMIQPFFRYLNLSERTGFTDTLSFEDAIHLDHVSFRYPDQAQNAVEDINLTIKKGEIIAIVGENGAGKTTLAQLITGLFQPSSGIVYYDDRDIATVFEPILHKGQSIVPQAFNRYKMTLADNIAIGDFRKQSHQGIEQQYSKFMSTSGVSPNTMLGKEFGGIELSGGQWQQLSCARGFYKDSDFLVLDEATSAIDPLKEKAMYNAFKDELNGKTGIIITHRLSAIPLADKIIVLERGRVVQAGTHSQLVKEDGLYSQLWDSQTKPFSEE